MCAFNLIVSYCNENTGFIGAVLSIVSVFISVIAIWISISTSKRQNKIALIDKRVAILDKIDNYVRSMDSWEFSQYTHKVMSCIEIETFFNADFCELYKSLLESGEKIEVLWGDYQYAEDKGSCCGKELEEIEGEIRNIAKTAWEEFSKIKNQIYKEFLSL